MVSRHMSHRGGRTLEIDDGVWLTAIPLDARCGCGERVAAGERAGFESTTGRVVCLWCLADRKAGRQPPRRRKTTHRPSGTTHQPSYPVRDLASGESVDGPGLIGLPGGSRRSRRSRRSRWAAQPTRLAPRSSPRTGVTVFLVVLALIGAAYVDNGVLGHESVLRAFGINQLPGVPSRGPDRAIPTGADATHYAFMATRRPVGNDPVTWSPCRTIHLVVNKAAAPPQADRLLRESLDRVSELSGLKFVVDGETDETPVTGRPPQNRNPLKGRWAPALVAWTTPDVVPALAGNVAGVGGPREAPYSYPDERHYVSGVVYLRGPTIASILRRSDGWAQSRAIVMHELGHMVGLAHVDSNAELMDANNDNHITDFGPGDREGLRRLGSGPCLR